ncbi:class I SAM-dependent rRNA methyltransferase [Listeria ivanovii]|uniref:class I SAM-dependent rRNA methyltransferase n=1 Tax=Listeria ivanovii TaxID=1638 RepID=UPI0005128751|nr:class I SAM-dependent rRNA methyltransferase [Listeria ivanovii]AIS61790.1 50S rRNA methyltransferase [Listeria ivanovii subsp. londoniensis]MBK1965763.1 class I SAM-dependent rRNA methyltransferase [Listeria ivanovii subsp. londoniensis]MBK1984890.1 class I SAM-dependent rRNA methyltransferase [Listeria ivanovii subsp. londoniensis]MBK1995603.1 class I SAM-dependent rRNA methyltransferase [Listeria ivanovii subsp. londoniensis]MBK2001921.1 class I SAM-dependent rRNA methyltransferase [List
MKNSIKVKIFPKFTKGYKEGYPLILKERMEKWPKELEEGDTLELIDASGKFVARGYHGKQNKGDGWLFTWDKKEQLDETFLTNLITTAKDKRQFLFADDSTTAFRIFNGEGDGFGGFTADYYDGYLVIQWYSIGIYSFQKMILDIFMSLPEIKGIYEKRRFQEDTKDDFVAGQKAAFPLIIKENGINYATYLDDGWMTGIFLDQRDVRRRISEDYAISKNVLNTFSYTGAFSVAALFGGASKTTSVDVAGRSLAKTKEQLEVNGLDPATQSIIVEDVFHYFKYALRKQLTFDLIIVDPPSFARTKKVTFRAAKDYPNLLREIIDITATGGTIIASTNYAGFGMKAFKKMIATAFESTERTYKITESHSLPADFTIDKNFPEGNYLKVLFLTLDR